jgi:hypothetical protein
LTELSYLTPAITGFKDRSGMLLVVGILFIVAGGLCGCLTATMPLAVLAPRPPGQPQPRVTDMLTGLLVYAGLCAALLTLGIGCVRKRRWVRPLIIVLGWIGLAGGVIGMITWGFALPQMGNAMRAAAAAQAGARGGGGGAAPPAAFFTVMIGIMTVFFAFIYVIVPAALLWLFRSGDVQRTLEHYDPQPRWTDAVPVPVLGLCALLALGGLWALASAMQGWFLAFGVIMSGAAARVAALLVAAAFATAALFAFRLRPAGWWMALALFVLLPLAWITTLLRHDLTSVYRAMGRSDAELQVLANVQVMNGPLMSLSIGAFAAGTIAFTLSTRKYFVPRDLPPAPPLPA